MRTRSGFLVTALAAVALAVAACSSASSGGSSSGSGSGSGSGGTIQVGLLSDLTGAYADGPSMEGGVKARFALQNAEGGVDGKKLEYVQADTTSTVPGTLSAAQTLVQQDHVLGILDGAFDLSGAQHCSDRQCRCCANGNQAAAAETLTHVTCTCPIMLDSKGRLT